MGSSVSIKGLARLGSQLSVFHFANLGSSLSVRNFCRFGASLSVKGGTQLGQSVSAVSDILYSADFETQDATVKGNLKLASGGWPRIAADGNLIKFYPGPSAGQQMMTISETG